jgi:hypothetical protein
VFVFILIEFNSVHGGVGREDWRIGHLREESSFRLRFKEENQSHVIRFGARTVAPNL